MAHNKRMETDQQIAMWAALVTGLDRYRRWFTEPEGLFPLKETLNLACRASAFGQEQTLVL